MDAGVYIRGDMVKLFLQNNVPVVIAHDTASDVGSDVDEGLYGWFKVKTPPGYEKISSLLVTARLFGSIRNFQLLLNP